MMPIGSTSAVWLRLFSSLTAAGLLLVAQTRAADNRLTLVDQGKSDYVIVVDPGALETPKFAARELQTYVEKVSGAKLPIAAKLPTGKKPIFVGQSASTEALGLSVEDLKPEGFLVRTVGTALVIIGRDTPGNPLNMHWKSAPQTGTFYGVCAFLEKYLGMRWFMPTELGEVVPRTDSISLPAIDLRESPSFLNRSISFSGYDQHDKEGARWLRRNRVGHSLIVSCSHNWWSIIPCDPSPRGWPSYMEPRQPYRDHPEYYALVNGHRRMSHYGDRMGGEVCTTNPDVIRIFAETAVDYFRKHPDEPMFSISWNDGGVFCECDRCRALDSRTDAKGRPILADRLATFYNAVGRLVYEKCPDKLLGAYVFYGGDLPQRTGIFRNIYLSSPYNEISTLFFNAEYRRRAYDQIRAWGKLCDNMSFYSAYHGSGFWSFPYSSTPLLADLFPVLKAAGNKGITFYGVDGWGGNGLDLYLACRLSWDASLDVQTLVNDYYDRFYGPASGPAIRAWHSLLRGAARNLTGNTRLTDLGTLAAAGQGMIEPLYAGIRRDGRKLIDSALAAAPAGPLRQRVGLVSDSWRLVEITLDALAAYRTVEKVPSQANAVAFKQAVDAREQFLEGHKTSLAIAYGEVRRCDQIYQLPTRPEVAEHFLARKGLRKLAECRKSLRAPLIDGKLDDACWQEATVLADFGQKDLGTPVKFATQARLLYDDKFLYLGVRCEDPDPAHLLAVETARDGKVWDDNELEIFFDPERDGRHVYHFLLNHLGTVCDMKIENAREDPSWNSAWIVKTARHGGGWSAEIAIPWADMGAGVPVPGDLWRFNICRVRRSSADQAVEYSAYSPTFGLFNRPDRFADVVFK